MGLPRSQVRRPPRRPPLNLAAQRCRRLRAVADGATLCHAAGPACAGDEATSSGEEGSSSEGEEDGSDDDGMAAVARDPQGYADRSDDDDEAGLLTRRLEDLSEDDFDGSDGEEERMEQLAMQLK